MEPTLNTARLGVGRTTGKAGAIGYWIATALFCLEMSFTAWYMLAVLPAGAQAIARLGFPPYFRIELACAKLIGVLLLLVPVPPRLKEWAYAGFAINLASALIAHLSMGDGPDALVPSGVTSLLWAISYLLWRRRQSRLAPLERRLRRGRVRDREVRRVDPLSAVEQAFDAGSR
jgi:hypothetical protein